MFQSVGSIADRLHNPAIEQSIRPAHRNRLTGYVANFLNASKHLLFQERCRVCSTLMHPELKGREISGINQNEIRPPASLIFAQRELICDSVCCICWLSFCSNESTEGNLGPFGSDQIQSLCVVSSVHFRGEVKKLVYKFKYDNDILLARDLAILSLSAWQKLAPRLDFARACLVPVPLHRDRFRERGFNQSEMVARHLGRFASVKVLTGAIARVKKTASQQALGKLQRFSNVKAAFQANVNLVSGKEIVLVDDVCTSGATLYECAKTLQAAGVSSIFALTVAKVDLS